MIRSPHLFAPLSSNLFSTVDICERIAEKLRDSSAIANILSVQSQSFHSDLTHSLAHGLPGLSLFYSALHQYFPDKDYDEVAHEYLKLSTHHVPSDMNISFFYGLSGLCFAVYYASKNGEYYSRLLSQLDDLLVNRLDQHLHNMEKQPYQSTDYQLIYGISGPLIYLLSRRHQQSNLQFYAAKCVEKLIDYLNREIIVDGYVIPGWFSTLEFTLFDSEKSTQQGIAIDMLNGIPGFLSLLSIVYCEGLFHPKLESTLITLSEWLKQKKMQSTQGPFWPPYISPEQEIGKQDVIANIQEETWNMGTVTTIRSLYLAGKALNSKSLKDYAIENLVEWLSYPHAFSQKGASFASGKAGLLATIHCMVEDTNNSLLLKKVNELEFELKNFYNPNHPFGFQASDSYKDIWLDDPSLIGGVSGIVLSLLLAQKRDNNGWVRVFLLR